MACPPLPQVRRAHAPSTPKTVLFRCDANGIHLNNVGSYVVGCTFFATLYRENPKGSSGEAYKVTDPKLAAQIQDTVWKVVSENPLAGVACIPAANGSK
ncbi:MAG: hypothetical protein ACYC35_02680 [Pirellulales bacterium]